MSEKLVICEPQNNNKKYCAVCEKQFSNEKIAIEYNGDFWHCNPEKYDKDYFNPKKKKYAFKILEDDLKRLEMLKNNQYKVLIIWESSYKNNKKETIKNCWRK